MKKRKWFSCGKMSNQWSKTNQENEETDNLQRYIQAAMTQPADMFYKTLGVEQVEELQTTADKIRGNETEGERPMKWKKINQKKIYNNNEHCVDQNFSFSGQINCLKILSSYRQLHIFVNYI